MCSREERAGKEKKMAFWGVGQSEKVGDRRKNRVRKQMMSMSCSWICTMSGLQLLLQRVRMLERSQPTEAFAKLQQSILAQFNRLSYNQQPPSLYFKPQHYDPLPPFLPQSFLSSFQSCLHLTEHSLFDMLTFMILQVIFSAQYQERDRMLTKMRWSICQEQFLFGSGYIKGLMVKGMRKLAMSGCCADVPVANCLKDQDILNAFGQFWKEVIEQQSQGQVQALSDKIDPAYFKYLSNYLGMNFHIYQLQNNDNVNQIVVNPQNKAKNTTTASVLMIDPSSDQETQEYLILLPQKRKSSTFGIDLMEIEITHRQKSQEFKNLRTRAWEVKQKGGQLVRMFRDFYNLVKIQ